MILRLLASCALLLPNLVHAADDAGLPQNLQQQLDDLNRTLSGQTIDQSCWMDPTATGKNCNKTSDDFCRMLFDDGGGTMKVFDGVVRAGNSDKSGLSLAQIDDYRALVNSGAHLPKDLRGRAAPALAKLKQLLAQENDSKKWSRDVADAYREFQRAEEDTKEARESKKGAEQPDLDGEIVKAKYAAGANWKRVQRLFPEAKADLLKVIDDLNISPERKAHMRERVSTVTLTLPDGTDDCGTTQVNAFYTPETHTFTVCAGLFNSYATDSGLFQTIAHEISHSIDPGAESTNDYRRQSPLGQALNRLVGAKGSVIPCDEWSKISGQVLATPAPPIRRSELDPFYACLEPRDKLKPWTAPAVGEVADIQSNSAMNDLAKNNIFLTLAQPTFTEDGKVKPNPKFMRPDLIDDDDSDDSSKRKRGKEAPVKSEAPAQPRDAAAKEIFTQILSCERTSADSQPYPQVTDTAERRKLFANALQTTEDLVRRQKLEFYSFCGQTCTELMDSGFGHDPSENWADWMANRAQRFLFARIDTPAHRQEAAALGNALLCDEAGPKRDAPGLAAEEKKFSTEVHPDDRIRRVSEYDAVVAHQLGCTLSPNQGFGPCSP